jgi:acylphosphatase
LLIVGRVQGVGYRAAFAREATALKLSGWVRNRADGSVEAMVSGAADTLEKMIDWARRGPPAAQVRAVSVTDMADSVAATGQFEIRPIQ